MEELLERGRRTLEEYIGLPEGILTRVFSTDDWTFVLQIHGLLDAAVDHLVTSNLDEPTRSWVSRLDLQSGKGSKVSFGVAHGTLSSADQAFIRNLSALRAAFAHDIRMTAVPLAEFLSKEEGKSYFDGLVASAFLGKGMPVEESEKKEWLSRRPRDVLFAAVSDFISRAFDIKVKDRHALLTEDGAAITTEDGRVLLDEAAPADLSWREDP